MRFVTPEKVFDSKEEVLRQRLAESASQPFFFIHYLADTIQAWRSAC
jgi:hypothetical protein